MPEKYLAMKEKFMREGMSEDAAQEKAAKIYNSQRPAGSPPVTKDYDAVHKASGRMEKRK